jgi:hypothetical protein
VSPIAPRTVPLCVRSPSPTAPSAPCHSEPAPCWRAKDLLFAFVAAVFRPATAMAASAPVSSPERSVSAADRRRLFLAPGFFWRPAFWAPGRAQREICLRLLRSECCALSLFRRAGLTLSQRVPCSTDAKETSLIAAEKRERTGVLSLGN